MGRVAAAEMLVVEGAGGTDITTVVVVMQEMEGMGLPVEPDLPAEMVVMD